MEKSLDLEKRIQILEAEKLSLQKQVQKYEDLVAVSPALFGFVSTSGVIIDLNNLALEAIKVPKENIIGKIFWECPWWEQLPKSISKVKKAVEDASHDIISEFDLEYWGISPEDDQPGLRWVELRFAPYQNHEGQVVKIAVSGIDITPRKKFQAELVTQKHKFEAIFDVSPAAMALWTGKDLIFEKVNPKYQNIFGNRQLEGLPILEALPELQTQLFVDQIKQVMDTGTPVIAKEALVRLKTSEDGTFEDRYFNYSFIQIKDLDGKPYGVYDHAVDVTEQVKNRKAVESSNRRLAELVAVLEQEREAKDRFFAGLSHDLRTPFAVAKSSAELLELLLPSESDLKQFTSVIKKNMDRADNMIKDLLYAKQIQSGEKIPLRVKKVELVGLIKETLANLAVIHGDRFILKGDSDVMGCWDPSLIRRAVENIVINAIKYGHEDLPITVIVNSTDNNASIKIHNFGEPISESDQQRIFQPNQRGQIETNLFPGWGLGLTLVVGITKAHNGTVALSSNRDDGTSFFLEIPLKS